MSVTQQTTESVFPNTMQCPSCKSTLPADATFCGVCGERIGQTNKAPSEEPANVSGRYRITALIRRRPYLLLFRAFDNAHQRPVSICDIDISALEEEKRQEALAGAQREYDRLRHEHVQSVMPVIDLRYFQEHLYVVTGSPSLAPSAANVTFPSTLQDLLQSGLGLPGEQVAVTWMYRLSSALQQLHALQIVIGDLDPNAIMIQGDAYNSQPLLAVSWLPSSLRSLLPSTSTITNMAHFYAPEMLQGDIEPTSDIYSIGAILYLLLTGTPPDEAGQRVKRSLRSPRDLNPRVSARADELVMRALALESPQRFQSAQELAQALLELCSTTVAPRFVSASRSRGPHHTKQLSKHNGQNHAETQIEDSDDVTISIVPIQSQMARWYLSKRATQPQPVLPPVIPVEEPPISQLASPEAPVQPVEEGEDADNVPTQEVSRKSTPPPIHDEQDIPVLYDDYSDFSAQDDDYKEPEALYSPIPPMPEPIPRLTTSTQSATVNPRRGESGTTGLLAFVQRLREQLVTRQASGKLQRSTDESSPPQRENTTSDPDAKLLRRLQRFVLGEQQHGTTAAALIETPLRVQPNQGYVIRIHLMGRNEPAIPTGATKDAVPVGLSSVMRGETVHIEVRSALYQNYAYIVQRADVQIPARGFAAEVIMPMQPLTGGSGGRRERLQIFFKDEEHHSLYEQPFVVEVFISHLVQSGREGHNVLSIPL